MNRTTYVASLFQRLRHLQTGTTRDAKAYNVPDNVTTELDRLERRMLEVLRRDEAGTPERDGFPSGGIGGGRGGACIVVEDEDGNDDSVPVTSVEAAAIARIEARAPRDIHGEHVRAAVARLEAVVIELEGVYARVEACEANANGVNVRHDPSGYCLVCDRYVEGTDSDRLRRGICPTDYRAWVRAGRPDIAVFRRTRRNDNEPTTHEQERAQ